MNHQNSGSVSGLASSAAAYTQPQVSPPQPTDMQTHIQRAQEVAERLTAIHTSMAGLIGRLYGEGQTGGVERNPAPQPVGLSHELTSALSTIEAIAERLDVAATRLAQHA